MRCAHTWPARSGRTPRAPRRLPSLSRPGSAGAGTAVIHMDEAAHAALQLACDEHASSWQPPNKASNRAYRFMTSFARRTVSPLTLSQLTKSRNNEGDIE